MALLERIQLELGAHEPWPKDVKLYQPYEVEQILLTDNANCLASQAYLKMCNLEFQVVQRSNAEFMSPTGKVPFIRAGAFIIPEFEGIVQFVNGKGISLTPHLETEQKSDMRAYMSLVHNVLENAELYISWCDPETYREVTKPRNGSVYPFPLNHIQTWSKRNQSVKRLKMFGWYGKTLQDVYQEVETCCQALTHRLQTNEYFFGHKFSDLDALFYGHLKAIATKGLCRDPKLAAILGKFDNLLDHCRRIDALFFKREPDFSFIIANKTVTTEKKDVSEQFKEPFWAGSIEAVDLRSSESKTALPIVEDIEMESGDKFIEPVIEGDANKDGNETLEHGKRP